MKKFDHHTPSFCCFHKRSCVTTITDIPIISEGGLLDFVGRKLYPEGLTCIINVVNYSGEALGQGFGAWDVGMSLSRSPTVADLIVFRIKLIVLFCVYIMCVIIIYDLGQVSWVGSVVGSIMARSKLCLYYITQTSGNPRI